MRQKAQGNKYILKKAFTSDILYLLLLTYFFELKLINLSTNSLITTLYLFTYLLTHLLPHLTYSLYKHHWHKTIRTTLNECLQTSTSRCSRKDEYVLLGTGVSMVQLGLYVFALSTVAMKITHLQTESVPTGLGGVYGKLYIIYILYIGTNREKEKKKHAFFICFFLFF